MKLHVWILLSGLVSYFILLHIAFTHWSDTSAHYVSLTGLVILASYSWYTGEQRRRTTSAFTSSS